MDETRRVCSKCGNSYPADVIFCPKDGTPLGAKPSELAEDPYLGLEVQGQFRIEKLIGIGAMGRVYRAHQTGIERQVAIKILHRELLRNETVMTRFHREAKVASRLTHPNVVQILMTGALQKQGADVGGEAYLVMEHLDGISLRSALAAADGALPLPRALHIILQVCDAVGEAHAQGIVHRDLKPENVMLIRQGDDRDFVKVLDFGVARIEWADSTVATQAGSIFGTARYISPEGAQGEPVGPPSDVYSIATILFQCLSGRTPFDGESPVAILIKQTSEQPPDVRSIVRASYVPEPVAAVIRDNLAKDPAARCPDARAFGRALVDAARSSGLSPGDLVARSTLLGGAGALSLQSIQRTRALKLTPELSARMANDGSGPEKTAANEPARSTPAGAGPEPPPQSTVEPTLSDETADDVARASVPPGRPSSPALTADGRSSFASMPPPSEQPRPSLPSSDWTPGGDEGALRTRRIAVMLLCFTVGAGLAVAAALQLGVFEQPEPPAEQIPPVASQTPTPSAPVPPAAHVAAEPPTQPQSAPEPSSPPPRRRSRRRTRPRQPAGTKPQPSTAKPAPDAGAAAPPPAPAPGGRWL